MQIGIFECTGLTGADPEIMKGGAWHHAKQCALLEGSRGSSGDMLPQKMLDYTFNFLQPGSKIVATVDLRSSVDCA